MKLHTQITTLLTIAYCDENISRNDDICLPNEHLPILVQSTFKHRVPITSEIHFTLTIVYHTIIAYL